MKESLIKKLLIPVFALCVLLLMVAWLAGSFNEKVSPAVKTIKPITGGNLHSIKAVQEPNFEPVAASVTAKQATIISSRILARIESINVRAGETVEKGQLLIQLEQSDLQAQVLQAKEKVNAASARYVEAEKNLKRSKDLYSKQLVSEIALDKSQSNYDALSAELTSAKQALTFAETALSYTELRSPINGRVVDRFAEPGNTAQTGTKLLSLYNPLSLRVEGQVREELALSLQQGQVINVEFPSIDKTVEARIEEIVPAANTGSRSFLVKATIEFSKELLPGMYARMQVPAGIRTSIYVPKTSVTNVGQLNMVWVVDSGIKQRRFIRLGKENNQDEVAVISGLSVGERVLTNL